MSKDNPLNLVMPPRPGQKAPEAPRQEAPVSPQDSPHLKEGDVPLWMSCRATAGCEGNYAVKVFGDSRSLQAGGGSWVRYRCLACGGVFHISR